MDPFAGSQTTVDRWVSPETFNFLFNELEIGPMETPKQLSSEVAVIGISGMVHKDGTLNLYPWYRFEGTPDIPFENSGEYSIEYQEMDGTLFTETGFDLDFGDNGHEFHGERDFAGFSLKIPDLPGTARILIRKGTATLAEKQLTPAAPSLDLISPDGGEVYMTGETMTVDYNAADQDGDDLFHTILFSPDGGEIWLPLTVDYVGNGFDYEIPPNSETDQGLIRIVTTDGFNTTEDVSQSVFCIVSGADLDSSGGVEANDLLILLEEIRAGTSTIDFTCEPKSDIEDLFEFSRRWHSQ